MNGKPARMLAGNVFETTLDMASGTNTVTVQATDVSGNVTTQNYQVNVTGAGATYTYDPNGNLSNKDRGNGHLGLRLERREPAHQGREEQRRGREIRLRPAGEKSREGRGRPRRRRTPTTARTFCASCGGASTFKYVHGPGVDEPLAREDTPGAPTYYHADGLGSVIKRTAPTGAVVHEYRYDVWGRIEAGATEPGFAFTGREWDPEIAFYYYRARYLDPNAARFASPDPLGLSGGSVNLYAYTKGDPVNWSDPTGLKINSTVHIRPPRFNVPKTCLGSPAATCAPPQSLVLATEPCTERSCGRWGFDATVQLTIWQEFTLPPTTRSGDSPGKTLQQHEDLHVDDFTNAFRPVTIEKEVSTEGFGGFLECERARRLFEINMDIYFYLTAGWTHVARDRMQ